jgi:hypothetical protein
MNHSPKPYRPTAPTDLGFLAFVFATGFTCGVAVIAIWVWRALP